MSCELNIEIVTYRQCLQFGHILNLNTPFIILRFQSKGCKQFIKLLDLQTIHVNIYLRKRTTAINDNLYSELRSKNVHIIFRPLCFDYKY